MAWGAVVAGGLLASALQFTFARRLLRARIERTLAAKPSLAAIQPAVTQDELRLQLLLRLTPLNPATIRYLLGAAGVRSSRCTSVTRASTWPEQRRSPPAATGCTIS